MIDLGLRNGETEKYRQCPSVSTAKPWEIRHLVVPTSLLPISSHLGSAWNLRVAQIKDLQMAAIPPEGHARRVTWKNCPLILAKQFYLKGFYLVYHPCSRPKKIHQWYHECSFVVVLAMGSGVIWPCWMNFHLFVYAQNIHRHSTLQAIP